MVARLDHGIDIFTVVFPRYVVLVITLVEPGAPVYSGFAFRCWLRLNRFIEFRGFVNFSRHERDLTSKKTQNGPHRMGNVGKRTRSYNKCW